ncbi:hypothetical protein CS369_01555 [Candidatus Symbiopectobacterium sp. 'North America']|nr:hypothetical protein [Candidatus Symbiopectobacterium sp. 'North America']
MKNFLLKRLPPNGSLLRSQKNRHLPQAPAERSVPTVRYASSEAKGLTFCLGDSELIWKLSRGDRAGDMDDTSELTELLAEARRFT